MGLGGLGRRSGFLQAELPPLAGGIPRPATFTANAIGVALPDTVVTEHPSTSRRTNGTLNEPECRF